VKADKRGIKEHRSEGRRGWMDGWMMDGGGEGVRDWIG
jgi:hypothetical protein